MELRPKGSESIVAYPPKKARRLLSKGRWVRRIGVAVAFSSLAAFGLGCDGGVAIAGGMEPPDYFFCDENEPEPVEDFQYPGTFARYLCPGQSTWVELNIEEQVEMRLGLEIGIDGNDSDINAVLVDPDGVTVGMLDRDVRTLDNTFSPGVWRVTVTQRSHHSEGDFSLHIDEVPAG